MDSRIKTDKTGGNGNSLELILEFCTGLAIEMVVSGANIERVQTALQLICRAYGLTDVSIIMLNSQISIGARDKEGEYALRQANIPGSMIHLEKMKRLNRLSYAVVADAPPAAELRPMLEEACRARSYKSGTILAARTAAMICLCIMFGGGVSEVICTAVITVALHFVGMIVALLRLNRIVTSSLTMFIASVFVMLLHTAGLCSKAPVVLITLIMIFLPGIPLTNAVRNLICDNEMNGVLQLLKAAIETTALAAGIYVAIFLFKGEKGLSTLTAGSLSDPLLLIILSFVSCVCFAAMFQIPPHDLWRAGIGGVLTRIFLIFLPDAIPYTLVYTGLAALAASLYAEYLARKRQDPSTYFVYPAIIPLIPGGSFYYMIIGLIYHNSYIALENGYSCLLTLTGMSVGFVLSSSIAHYVRRSRGMLLTGVHAIEKQITHKS